jgi:hypothetical protein
VTAKSSICMWVCFINPDRVRGETGLLPLSMNTSVNEEHLMERIVDQSNVMRALGRVKQNRGSPGIDGMTVEELPGFLIRHWSSICDSLLTGNYEPQPVPTSALLPVEAVGQSRLSPSCGKGGNS